MTDRKPNRKPYKDKPRNTNTRRRRVKIVAEVTGTIRPSSSLRPPTGTTGKSRRRRPPMTAEQLAAYRAYQARYRAAHRQTANENSKSYYAKHKARILLSYKAKRAAHATDIRPASSYSRAYMRDRYHRQQADKRNRHVID